METMATRPQGIGAGFFLIAVGLSLAAAIALQQVLNAPLSRHAQEAHTKEIWNAEIGLEALRQKQCKAIEAYESDLVKTILVLCQIGLDPKGLWGGLFVRRTKEGGLIVVTGYATSRDRWERLIQRDGYKPISLIPIP